MNDQNKEKVLILTEEIEKAVIELKTDSRSAGNKLAGYISQHAEMMERISLAADDSIAEIDSVVLKGAKQIRRTVEGLKEGSDKKEVLMTLYIQVALIRMFLTNLKEVKVVRVCP